jgi:hypothetical protein
MLGLHDFQGNWLVSRRIDDRHSGRPGRFEGTASLIPAGEGLRYREEGTLTLGYGPAFPATRDYRWLPDGEGIEVRFADGRPFHRFRAEGAASGTDHPCGADLYRVTYDFSAWPDWRAEWTVTGPAKDYVMTSLYRRA